MLVLAQVIVTGKYLLRAQILVAVLEVEALIGLDQLDEEVVGRLQSEEVLVLLEVLPQLAVLLQHRVLVLHLLGQRLPLSTYHRVLRQLHFLILLQRNKREYIVKQVLHPAIRLQKRHHLL